MVNMVMFEGLKTGLIDAKMLCCEWYIACVKFDTQKKPLKMRNGKSRELHASKARLPGRVLRRGTKTVSCTPHQARLPGRVLRRGTKAVSCTPPQARLTGRVLRRGTPRMQKPRDTRLSGTPSWACTEACTVCTAHPRQFVHALRRVTPLSSLICSNMILNDYVLIV
jgi:hypothetical protein